LNCYPSEQYKRLLERGLPIVERKLDIVNLISNITLLRQANKLGCQHDHINLDDDTKSAHSTSEEEHVHEEAHEEEHVHVEAHESMSELIAQENMSEESYQDF
jgi:hypothetical protein